MVNDINTLNGSLSELGETMADNLVSMGVVDASASDGLTTLAGKILDIEPSIGGLDLDTAVTISSSESSISLGSSIVLTSKLTASYDDETIVDVDLSGVLQNATLLFKNGNTTIGTAVTDVNGVATFTYTPPSVGTLSLKTIFAGTDNFNNCESSFINVTVVAPSYDGIELSSDKNIISAYDEESATLTAQLMSGTTPVAIAGETITFEVRKTSDDSLVETLTGSTNSSGVATVSYLGKGSGDLNIRANVNSIIFSEIYAVEDCIRCWETLSIQGETIVNYALPSTFKLEFTIYSTSPTTDPSLAFIRFESSTSSKWIGKGGSVSRNVSFFGTTFNSISSTYTDYNYIMTYSNGVATLTDGTTTKTSSQTLSKLYYLNSKGGSQLKNIKLKPL